MEKTENSSLQDGEENKPEIVEEDQAREKSLQLGGGGLPGGKVFGKYTRFLRDVLDEMKKVTWPTRRMVVTETIVVLVVLVFFTALIVSLDHALSFLFNALLFGK